MVRTNKKLVPMLTVSEVAKLLHVHNNTVRRWSDRGIILGYRINQRGDRRFRPSDVVKVINQLRVH